MLSVKYAATHTFQFIARNKWFFLLYGATFLVLLPALCHDWEYSVYFSLKNLVRPTMRQDFVRQLEVNQGRAERVQVTLDNMKTALGPNHSAIVPNSPQVKLLVTVVTASRNMRLGVGPRMKMIRPFYLTQLTVKLLHSLREDPALQKETAILLCDIDLSEHSPEVKDLSAFAHVVQRFQTRTNFSIHPEMQWGKDPYEKEKQDYAFCLHKSLKVFNPDYILMLEDDAIPRHNIFPMVKHVTRYKMQNTHQHGDYMPRENIPAYIKLFHPNRLQGYISFEVDGLPELLGVSLLLGSFLHVLIRAIHVLSDCEESTGISTIATWCLCCCYWLLVALAVGRPHLQELRRISPYLYKVVPDQFCCTQALLFPAQSAHNVAHHLDRTKCNHDYAKDAAIFDFQKRSGSHGLLVQPNLFDHVGIVSSLRQSFVNPFYLDLPS